MKSISSSRLIQHILKSKVYIMPIMYKKKEILEIANAKLKQTVEELKKTNFKIKKAAKHSYRGRTDRGFATDGRY